MAKTVNPVWEQTGYRYRNDDGSETAATWIAALNTAPASPIDVDTIFRLRIQVSETAGQTTAEDIQGKLQYQLDGGTWTDVSGTSPVQFTASADTSWTINDGDATTEQLAGAQTFQAGTMEENATWGIISGLIGEDTEYEAVLTIDSGQVTDAQTLDFRVVHGASSTEAENTLLTITQAIGQIEVNEAGGTAYDETGKSIAVIATVTSTDVATLTDSTTVAITSTVTGNDTHIQTYDETGKSVSIIATVTGTDSIPESPDFGTFNHLLGGEYPVGTPNPTVDFGTFGFLVGGEYPTLLPAAHTASTGTTYDETGKTVNVTSTVTGSDIASLDDTGKTVAVTSAVAGTDVATFTDTGANVAVIATVTGTDGTRYDETGKAVAIVSTVTGTEAITLDETGLQVDVIATVTGNDTLILSPAALEQVAYRWRDDTVGLNVDSGWLAALNTDGPLYVLNDEGTLRLRWILENTGGTAFPATADWQLQARIDGGAWAELNFGDDVDTVGTSEYSNNDPTTQLLGSGTFEAGFGKSNDSFIINDAFAGHTETEHEFAIQIRDFGTRASGELIEFRIAYRPDDVTGWTGPDTVTNTPGITLVFAFVESGTVAIIGTVSGTDVAAFIESRSVAVVGTVTSTDTGTFIESHTVAVTSTVTGNDTHNTGGVYDETGKSVAIVATVTGTDALTMPESETVAITSTVTGTDTGTFTDTASVAIVATVTGTDARNIPESGSVPITSVVTGTDAATFNDSTSVAIIATVTGNDSHNTANTYDETGKSIAIVATVAGTDTGIFVDTTQVDITATVTGNDTHNSASIEYDETGKVVAVIATVTGTDAATFTDAAQVDITSTVTSTDTATFVDTTQVDIISTVTGNDALVRLPIDETGLLVAIVSTVTGSDGVTYIESGTVTGNASVSSSDIGTFLDSTTVDIVATLVASDSWWSSTVPSSRGTNRSTESGLFNDSYDRQQPGVSADSNAPGKSTSLQSTGRTT